MYIGSFRAPQRSRVINERDYDRMTKLARLTVSARSIGRRREEAGEDRLDCPLPLPCGGMPAILVVLIFKELNEVNFRDPQGHDRNHEEGGILLLFSRSTVCTFIIPQ